MFRWAILCFSLCLLAPVLPVGTTEKNLALSPLDCFFRCLYTPHCTLSTVSLSPWCWRACNWTRCWVQGKVTSLIPPAALLNAARGTIWCFWCWLLFSLVSMKTPKPFSAKLLSRWSPFLMVHRPCPQFTVLCPRIFYLNKEKSGGLSVHGVFWVLQTGI